MNMNVAVSSQIDMAVNEERLLEILNVAEEICQGNFDSRVVNIPVEDGLERRLSLKINEMIDRSDAYVRESTACLEFVANNQYFRRISPEGMLGAYGYAAEQINMAADGVEAKIRKFAEAVESISSAAIQLNTSAQQMGASVNMTSEKTASVSAAAEEAGANTQTVASAAEELNASIQEISRQVTASSKMSKEAVIQSEEVNVLVTGLSEASDKIGQVIKLINDIAGQTKLLALNATIEAARAGDAGKGFAVVASEVKSLSAQTEKATEDIRLQVQDIQSASGSAVTSIGDIGSSINKINEVATVIASAVEQQGGATQEISRNVQEAAAGVKDVTTNIIEVNQNVTQVREGSNQVMDIAGELNIQAENLKQVLNS